MAEYKIIKYPYGRIVKYTAFCLVPKLKHPKTIKLHGKTFTATSNGISTAHARHFQTPLAILSWLGSSGHKLLHHDFSPIQGTAIYGATR